MASGQNDTYLRTHPLQCAGGAVLELLRRPKAIDHLVVKRTRAQEPLSPRKSARLPELHRIKTSPAASRRKAQRHSKGTQQQQEPVSRKRPRTHNDRATPEEPVDERRKRRRAPAEKCTWVQALPDILSVDQQHPIAYWAANNQWPRQYLQEGKDMENILARKRSISSRSRKSSDTDSATPSSTNQGEQKSREQKSAEYKKPQYETVLATKSVLMESSVRGVSNSSREWCKDLLEREQELPEETLFRDDLFDSTCKVIRNRNETRVIRDIALLIVPSAEVLAIRGATHLQCLIESVNEGWNNSIPITKTRPQPDYATGFRREAFTQDQLDRMHPIIGDFNDQSYFMATWYMYFPFLCCEVKCGAAALDIADRQNAHSAAIAVRAVVELFRAVKREKEINREILAFSISHDHSVVRLYGYYADIDGAETKYYRHTIHKFDFTALDGKEKWSAYKFTKSVYDDWMPAHFKKICSAIDQIPADISFSVSQSDLRYPEQSSDLSQDGSAYSIAQTSEGSASVQTQDDQSSVIRDPATPSTSLTGGVFKKPRRKNARARS